MISNCRGCQIELEEIYEFVKMGLHFAGSGLYEKGHLIMIMVDDEGEIIVW